MHRTLITYTHLGRLWMEVWGTSVSEAERGSSAKEVADFYQNYITKEKSVSYTEKLDGPIEPSELEKHPEMLKFVRLNIIENGSIQQNKMQAAMTIVRTNNNITIKK